MSWDVLSCQLGNDVLGRTLHSATAVFLEATTDNSACNLLSLLFQTHVSLCLATYFQNVFWSQFLMYKMMIVMFNNNMHDTLYYEEYELCLSMSIAAKSA